MKQMTKHRDLKHLTVGELKEYIKDIPDDKKVLIGNWIGHGDINDHPIIDIHHTVHWGLRIVIELSEEY